MMMFAGREPLAEILTSFGRIFQKHVEKDSLFFFLPYLWPLIGPWTIPIFFANQQGKKEDKAVDFLWMFRQYSTVTRVHISAKSSSNCEQRSVFPHTQFDDGLAQFLESIFCLNFQISGNFKFTISRTSAPTVQIFRHFYQQQIGKCSCPKIWKFWPAVMIQVEILTFLDPNIGKKNAPCRVMTVQMIVSFPLFGTYIYIYIY